MSKIKFLKTIDNYLGRIFCTVFPPAGKSRVGKIEKILIIRPGGIGDAALLVPTIKLLCQQYPDVQVDILAEKRNAGLFDLVPEIHRVFHYDSLSGLFSGLCKRYDVVIDSEQWHRLSAVVARLIRTKMRIGFNTNERRRMFNRCVDYSHDDYEMESFLHLLTPLGIKITSPVAPPFLQCSEAEKQKVATAIAPLQKKPYVAIFPGASIVARQWGSKKFSELANLIAATGRGVVVVGGVKEALVGDEIVKNIGSGVNLAGQCSLAGSAEIISRSQLLVSGDSGALHIGVGLGVPTVSLFGSGIAAKWAPRGKKHVVINRHLSCSPCTRFGNTPECLAGVACMGEITVDEVYSSAIRLLKGEEVER